MSIIVKKALDSALAGQEEPPTSPEEVLRAIELADVPWDRLPGEPATWYERFLRYFLPQDPSFADESTLRGRSVIGAYRLWFADTHPGEPLPDSGVGTAARFHANARDWMWSVRAEAYDHYRQQLQLKKWEERRENLKEWEWNISVGVLHVVKALLEEVGMEIPDFSPPVQPVSAHQPLLAGAGADNVHPSEVRLPNPDGLKIKLSRTVRPNDLARLIEVADKIARLSADLATNQTAHVNFNVNKIRESRWQQAQDALQEAIVEGDYEETT